jgi:hypothetical protein
MRAHDLAASWASWYSFWDDMLYPCLHGRENAVLDIIVLIYKRGELRRGESDCYV